MKNVVFLNYIKNISIIALIAIIGLSSLFVFPTKVQAASTYTQTLKSGIESFPESYQNLLNQFIINTDHTNWTFKAFYTGIDWNEFIAGEGVCGRNRVYQGFDTAYRSTCGNLESSYYCASQGITAYFADPRNFINERNMFQFLETSYDEQVHTRAIVDSLVKPYNVFNKGNPITFVMTDENHPNYNQNVTMTFTDIIMKAAEVSRMSPISIAIKIVQEVGSNGSSSVSGTHSIYPNCYNYFNIGAYDSGDAIANALSYANNAGWHCPYTSIVEGAAYNARNYVQQGQNTAYLYKFDCVGNKLLNVGESQTITSNNLYHQYMTNIQDPYTQSKTLFSTYTNNELLDKPLSFVIPVFDNMPNVTPKISTLSNSNQELYYADISSSLSTRTSPSFNADKVTVEYVTKNGNTISEDLYLYKDDLVLMLNRNYTTSGGASWDRVQFWNGKIGYVASEYMEKYIPTTNPIPPEIPDDGNKPIQLTPEPNIGYGYANVSSSLNIRSGAGSTYNVIASAGPKEKMLILEDLENWFKVKLSSGKIGYATKEYVVKMEYIKVEDNTITIIPQITADIVAGYLNGKAFTVKQANVETNSNVLGTGFKLLIDAKEYSIVKMGDVNGDGKVSTRDAQYIQEYILEQRNLNDTEKSACNVNKDKTISTRDAQYVQEYVLEQRDLEL